jgi:hypothetical protein
MLPQMSRRSLWGLLLAGTVLLVIVVGPALTMIPVRPEQPITLLEDAVWGWEAQDLNFLFKASATKGEITTYQLGVNNDGVFDHTAPHIPKISGALAFDLPLLGLLGGPADDGDYPATVRIHNSLGAIADFPVKITIGNMPPEITFGENMLGEPGQPFVLEVATNDPGPDAVSQIAIDWGDGQQSVVSGKMASAGHVYATDGSYTIRATATDEDDSYWAEWIVNIGDTDLPVVPSDDPQITSAISTILPNGQASLALKAFDNDGSPDVSYEWDLDDDGLFELSGPSTVLLSPSPNFHTYMATVRITDAQGRWNEGLFLFGNEENKSSEAPNR